MSLKTSRRSVLITGGSGSVGQALVRSFATSGYLVTFQYSTDTLVANKLAKATAAKAWQADFTLDIKLPANNFDIVINCAGFLLKAPLTDLNDDIWNQTITVNLTAPFKIIRQYLPGMVKQKWGRIINIGSIWSLRALELNTAYTVSKHGLSGLTKSIVKEYAKFGITSNEICPGPIESELMGKVAEEVSARRGISAQAYLNEITAKIPSGKRTTPADIATLALFLASDEAAAINGVSIPIDGGQIC